MLEGVTVIGRGVGDPTEEGAGGGEEEEGVVTTHLDSLGKKLGCSLLGSRSTRNWRGKRIPYVSASYLKGTCQYLPQAIVITYKQMCIVGSQRGKMNIL